MHTNLHLSVIAAIVGISVLLIAASTFAPAAFAQHHHGVTIHQHIDPSQPCFAANCQQNAANVAQVGHDDSATVTQRNNPGVLTVW